MCINYGMTVFRFWEIRVWNYRLSCLNLTRKFCNSNLNFISLNSAISVSLSIYVTAREHTSIEGLTVGFVLELFGFSVWPSEKLCFYHFRRIPFTKRICLKQTWEHFVLEIHQCKLPHLSSSSSTHEFVMFLTVKFNCSSSELLDYILERLEDIVEKNKKPKICWKIKDKTSLAI